MEGKITKNGNIQIKRGMEFKLIRCVKNDSPFFFCNDECPLFGEFTTTVDDKEILYLCDYDITFDLVTDERMICHN